MLKELEKEKIKTKFSQKNEIIIIWTEIHEIKAEKKKAQQNSYLQEFTNSLSKYGEEKEKIQIKSETRVEIL